MAREGLLYASFGKSVLKKLPGEKPHGSSPLFIVRQRHANDYRSNERPVINDSGYNLTGDSMGTLKIWGIVAAILFVGVIGVFAFRHTEMFSKKPHSVNLHWQASPNATSYNIYRRTEEGSFAKIGSSLTATYVDSPVPSGAIFYYGVTTVEGQQESKISNVVRVEVPKD